MPPAKKKSRKPAAGAAPSTGREAARALPEPALRYRVGISMLLLVIAVGVLYPELVFQNKIIYAVDSEAAASFAAPIKAAMEKGERYPLWNPYIFSGMPSYESLSYNPNVYPVSLLTSFLTRYLRFPGQTWLLFHVFLLGLGVWLVLHDRGVHFLIATGAAVLLMWMPNHVAVGAHGHGSQSNAVAYMPFALFFWDRIWRGRYVALSVSALVLLLGCQLLRAHIQISYYTFALLGLHFVFFGALKVSDAFRARPGEGRQPEAFLLARVLRRERMSPGKAAFGDLGLLAVLLAVIVVGALLVSAVLMLPVKDYSKYSTRGASEEGGLDYDYATAWSLHPAEAATFVIPFSHGFGKHLYHGRMPFTDYPNYVGAVAALFALGALLLVRTRFARFLFFVAVVTTVLSFGRHLPILYDPLFNHFPFFNKFRVPVMVLIVQQLAVALLFGLGLSEALKLEAVRGRKYALWGLGAALAVFLLVIATAGYWTGEYARSIAKGLRMVRSAAEQMELARESGGFLFKDLIKLSLLLVASFGALYLYFRKTLSASAFAIVVLALALVDVYLVDRHILHPEKLFRSDQYRMIKDQSERERMFEPDAVIDFLRKDDELYRVFPIGRGQSVVDGDFRTNRYMNFGIASIGGYHAAKLSIYQDFIETFGTALPAGHFQLLDVLNVRYVVSASEFPPIPFLEEVWRGQDREGVPRIIYRNRNDPGRVFFADRHRVAPGKEALALLAAADGPDLSSTVLLDAEPAIKPVSAEGARAAITEYGLNTIKIEADMPSPAIMVLSEVFYPRWTVTVDGEPAGMLRANYVLRAVALSEGKHEVVFSYDSSFLRRSLVISLVACLAALSVLLASGAAAVRGRLRWKRSS